MSLHSRLSGLTKRISHTQSPRQKLTRARRRLAIERMEDRRLLATIDLATLTVAQGTTIFGAEPSQQSGTHVGSAGDINGDGYDDLIISAPGGVPGATQSYAGGSYVVFGGPTIPATIDLANLGPAGIRFIGADAGDGAGSSVSGAGDVNGDGFDDIIIGAAGADAAGNGKSNAGESYLVFGRASLPGTINLRTLGSATTPFPIVSGTKLAIVCSRILLTFSAKNS